MGVYNFDPLLLGFICVLSVIECVICQFSALAIAVKLPLLLWTFPLGLSARISFLPPDTFSHGILILATSLTNRMSLKRSCVKCLVIRIVLPSSGAMFKR